VVLVAVLLAYQRFAGVKAAKAASVEPQETAAVPVADRAMERAVELEPAA
jgi:hypothetical protein